MARKFSHRFLVRFSMACMVAGLLLGGARSAGAGAEFGVFQSWNISSNTWSVLAEDNYNTGVITYSDWFFGPWTYNYLIPFNASKGFFLYDYSQGRWVEALYLFDRPL